MLETHVIETGPQPRTTLIVLHGLGADGHDFVPICGELDLTALAPCATCSRMRPSGR